MLVTYSRYSNIRSMLVLCTRAKRNVLHQITTALKC